MSEYPIDRISPSMISAYIDCPILFYYTHIAKIQLPQKQQALVFGTAVHGAIEAMYNDEGKSLDPHAEFDRLFDINKFLEEEKDNHPELVSLGHEMVTNYIDYHPKLDQVYDLSAGQSEKRIRRKLINPVTGQESTLPLSGIIDRLAGDKIIEYKTAANKWKPDDARMKVQTLLYNLWYYSEYGEIADETLYFVLLKKYKRRKRDMVVQVLSARPTIDDLAAAWEEVELIVEKIRQGIYDEPVGGCGYFAKRELARIEEALALEDE